MLNYGEIGLLATLHLLQPAEDDDLAHREKILVCCIF